MTGSLRVKRVLGRACSPLAANSDARSIILIYHSVAGGTVSTRLENFKTQMMWLAEHVDVVSLDVLLDESKSGVKAERIRVALTFDDGYRTLFDTVAPILDGYGFPATVYLNTGEIWEQRHKPSCTEQGHYPDEEFMLWSEVAELQQRGWTIGSHGIQHVDLCLCNETEIVRQLGASKKEIEKRLDIACDHFSYTWGHYNDAVRKVVKQAGYRSAVAGRHGPVRASSDPFELPRLDVRPEYSMEDFVAVVCGKWDYLKHIQTLRAFFR